jgi:hypothetical protein
VLKQQVMQEAAGKAGWVRCHREISVWQTDLVAAAKHEGLPLLTVESSAVTAGSLLLRSLCCLWIAADLQWQMVSLRLSSTYAAGGAVIMCQHSMRGSAGVSVASAAWCWAGQQNCYTACGGNGWEWGCRCWFDICGCNILVAADTRASQRVCKPCCCISGWQLGKLPYAEVAVRC